MEAPKTGRKSNNSRRFNGPGPRPDNRKHRQEEAQERQAAWEALSPNQQLKELDRRLGAGKGAIRQRAQIQARIDNPRPRHSNVVAKTDGTIKKFGEKLAAERAEEAAHLKAKDRRVQEQHDRPGHS